MERGGSSLLIASLHKPYLPGDDLPTMVFSPVLFQSVYHETEGENILDG